MMCFMILLIDPEPSYLNQAKEILKTIGFRVLIADEQYELARIYSEFRDEINIIAFDSSRIGVDTKLTTCMRHVLRCASFSAAQCLEWNLYDWKESRNVTIAKYQ